MSKFNSKHLQNPLVFDVDDLLQELLLAVNTYLFLKGIRGNQTIGNTLENLILC